MIAIMKVEIANGGKNLSWLDSMNSFQEYLSEQESSHLSLLRELAEQYSGSGIAVDYPQDIYDRLIEQIQPKIEKYELAKKEYDIESRRRKPIIAAYNKNLAEYQQQKAEAAKKWAKENKVKIARSNSGKSLKKDWIKRLEKQGFDFDVPQPVNPFPQKLKCPQYPEMPEKNYLVNFENYVPGSLPEVEQAISWAKKIIDLPSFLCELDDDFICYEFEPALQEIVLERVKKDVLEVFSQVITGNLFNPQEIWQALTNFEIDYSEAIGMESYTNFRYYETTHRNFGKWHEINLSPTGYYLVEFKSTFDSTITFHLPYNRIPRSPIQVKRDELPKISTKQAKFGREINSGEKKRYPLEKLLAILELSPEDFPCELEKYSPISFPSWNDCDSKNYLDGDEDEDKDWGFSN